MSSYLKEREKSLVSQVLDDSSTSDPTTSEQESEELSAIPELAAPQKGDAVVAEDADQEEDEEEGEEEEQWDSFEASKPFAHAYLERMEELQEKRARKNYVPLFGQSVFEEAQKAALMAEKMARKSLDAPSPVGKLKMGFSRLSPRARRRKGKDKQSPASSPRGDSSPRLALHDTSSEKLVMFDAEFARHSVSYENPKRPLFCSPSGMGGQPVPCDCGLITEAEGWRLEEHVPEAAMAEEEVLIFPEQLVLNLDVKESEHYAGHDAELGPVAISCQTTPSGVEAALWSRDGGTELQVDAARIQKAATKKGRLQILRSVAVRDCKLSETTAFKLQMAPRFVEGLEGFAKNCRPINLKVGVLYCAAGQTDENAMYNNEHGSQQFEDFLDVLAPKVELFEWPHFSGGLDTKRKLTGRYSRYTDVPMPMLTQDFHIMFHVSTYLPFSQEPQQLKRKRHIGNDVVVIVFQDDDCEDAFDPLCFRSHFVHVVLVVRALSNGGHRVSVCIKDGVLGGTPPYLPDGGFFGPSDNLHDWLLLKLANLERAALYAPVFLEKLQKARTMELEMML